MIRRLRRRHLRLVTGVAVIAAAGVVAALAARPEWPLAPAPAAPATAVPMGEWEGLWEGAELTTRLAADAAGTLRLDLDLDLDATGDPAVPDPLVYWSPEPAQPGGPLPAGSVLAGALVDGRARGLGLPPDAAGGTLVLYSLAHQRVVATATLPGAGLPEEG